MYKGVTILYLVCFSLYVLYTREPDFFDGETQMATIHWQKDSAANEIIPKAVFSQNNNNIAIDARYVFRNLPEGKKVTVIYLPSKLQKAAVYHWWGYWIRWQELLISALLFIGLFQVAVSVTKNPTAESLLEQLEYKEEKKTKYS